MRRREKKTTHLEIRISPDRKRDFMKACADNGTNASDAVRSFVDAYIARSRSIRLKQFAKDVAMKLVKNPVRTSFGTGAALASGLGIAAMLTGVSTAQDQYVQPLNLPTGIVYPTELAENGIEGKCEVRFSVDKRGFVEPGAKADCSHDGFVRPAENAVYSLRFEPNVVDGKPERMTNLIYPFEFSMGFEE